MEWGVLQWDGPAFSESLGKEISGLFFGEGMVPSWDPSKGTRVNSGFLGSEKEL